MNILLGIVLSIATFILGICVIVPFLNFIRGESDPTTKEIILWIVGVVMWIIVGVLHSKLV
jgi:hypothetical protein|tara:strand:- start:66 stop:248 length:183 start_codon:yes stop_codon:yes gene_type:complete